MKAITNEMMEPRRFSFPDEVLDAKKHLRDHGYAVVQALSQEECDDACDGFWNWVEHVSTARRRAPSTWSDKQWPVHVPGTGILCYHGIGQAEFMWQMRTKSSITGTFAAIWDCDPEDLVTSFDGCIAFRPWVCGDGMSDDDENEKEEVRSRKTKAGWWHCDQHPGVRKDFDCVQGLVNVGLPTSEETGGNVRVCVCEACVDGKALLIAPTQYDGSHVSVSLCLILHMRMLSCSSHVYVNRCRFSCQEVTAALPRGVQNIRTK